MLYKIDFLNLLIVNNIIIFNFYTKLNFVKIIYRYTKSKIQDYD